MPYVAIFFNPCVNNTHVALLKTKLNCHVALPILGVNNHIGPIRRGCTWGVGRDSYQDGFVCQSSQQAN